MARRSPTLYIYFICVFCIFCFYLADDCFDLIGRDLIYGVLPVVLRELSQEEGKR